MKATITNTPTRVYRVSIHNQIYNTIYYVVTEWVKAKNGGWKTTGHRWGVRGKGNSLGLTYGQAAERAEEWNRELGWTKEMKVLTAKGTEAFDLHI